MSTLIRDKARLSVHLLLFANGERPLPSILVQPPQIPSAGSIVVERVVGKQLQANKVSDADYDAPRFGESIALTFLAEHSAHSRAFEINAIPLVT
jgi:hypothetical protein